MPTGPWAVGALRTIAAIIFGGVEAGVFKAFAREGRTDEDQGRAGDVFADVRFQSGQRGADHLLVGPAGAVDHGDGAVRAIGRGQVGDDPIEIANGQVDGQCCACGGKIAERDGQSIPGKRPDH